MNALQERINAARDLGVLRLRATEPELSWFLEAAQFKYDHSTGELKDVTVTAHYRSWWMYQPPAGLEERPVEDLADTLVGWIRGAMEKGMLTPDDPPTAPHSDPHAKIKDMAQARLTELRARDGVTGEPAKYMTRPFRGEQIIITIPGGPYGRRPVHP